MSNKILVTGATGKVGKAVIKNLQKRNADFVAGVRDIEKAKKVLGNAYSFVKFDVNDPATFADAFQGVKKLFLLGPPVEPEAEKPFFSIIDFAKNAGIEHIQVLSVYKAADKGEIPHRKIEKYAEASGIPYTHLRPNFFHQNFIVLDKESIRNGAIVLPAGNGKTSYVDVEDIGEAAAIILTEEGHTGKAYEITGSQALDFYQIADLFTHYTGHKVTYHDIPAEQYKATLESYGIPEYGAQFFTFLYDTLIKKDLASGISPDLATILGREPNSLENFIKTHAQVWQQEGKLKTA